MAQTGRLILPASKPFGVPLRPVTTLRILIIAAVLVGWEALAASGLLYRDVVPSLLAIVRALVATLRDPAFYFHLGTTAYEIGIAMLIGGLSGGATELNPGLIFSKRANVQGIYVGSTQMFEAMNAAIIANRLKPVIDRVFGFDEVPAALRHMEAGAHFGKIVIRVA